MMSKTSSRLILLATLCLIVRGSSSSPAPLDTPSINNISPTTVTTGSFSLTINGSNFNTSTAQIVLTGPNCPTITSCVVPNGVLTTKPSGQLVGPVPLN